MKLPRTLSLCAILSTFLANSLVSAEGWTGKLVYKVKTSDYTTELRVFTNGSAWRYEMGNPADPHTVWLVLPGQEETYEISNFKQTYSVVPDSAQDREGRPEGAERDHKSDKRREVSIKPIGEKEINGHPCHGYEIKSEGPDTEVWLDTRNSDFRRPLFLIFHKLRVVLPGLARLQPESLGLPVRVSQKTWVGRTVFGLELVSQEEEPVPDEMFTFPEGYRRVGADVRPQKDRWR